MHAVVTLSRRTRLASELRSCALNLTATVEEKKKGEWGAVRNFVGFVLTRAECS